MKQIKIGQTDIFLEDFEKEGQGKITISDDWRGAYTYFWGAMGSNISEFILRINSDYFADKLCKNTYVFDGKLTAKNIRKHIREELPYWRFMSAQKEMRKEIKKIESITNADEFVNMCPSIPDNIYCTDLSYGEEIKFKNLISDLFKTECWDFIGEKLSPEYKWLYELHGKLKIKLNESKN